ncbi:MAG: hypothetical protein IIC91_12725 [Chloroflexi bacterium]|nr:hypothetical protein [Chloroflexota bacterium]
MMTWRVRLQGHEFDLEEVAAQMRSPDLAVEKGDDGHYLVSSEFEIMTDSSEVLRRAQEIVAVLNGTLRTRGSGYRPIDTAGVVDRSDDHGRHRIISVSGTLEIRSKVSARAIVIGADGNVKEQATTPAEDAGSIVNLASDDEPVARALRIYGAPSIT